MAGIMIPPIAAAVAGPEPEIAANSILATIAAVPSPPAEFPVNASAMSTSFFASPPLDIKVPTSMKNGIAISGNESQLFTIDWASIRSIPCPGK